MNRHTRTLLVLGVAITTAGGASWAVYHALQQTPRGEAAPMIATVVAAREVPAGSMLSAGDLKIVSWPAGAAVPTSFRKVEDVVGRGTIDILHQHEPLLASKLAPRGAGAGLPPTIPPGLRAISIRVNEVIGVAGFVVPGSRVDVLVTLANRTTDGDTSTTRMVVSHVQVLAAGTRIDQDKAQKDGKPIPSTVVTLQVTPEDAERIALAQSQGQITLTLRNPMDRTPTTTPGVRLANLLGTQTSTPVKVEMPRGPRPRPAVPVVAPARAEPATPVAYTVEAIRAAKRTEEIVR